MMSGRTSIYRLTEVPDPAHPSFRLAAGGDGRAAAQADGEHLVRTLSEFGPGSASVTLRFDYRPPITASDDPQGRLAVYLMGQARDNRATAALSLLLDRGPFHRFFNFEPVKRIPPAAVVLSAACDVVRRQSILEPTITTELHPQALWAYYTIRSFEPRQDNDFLRIDSVLDRLSEPVVVEICLEPASVAAQLSDHTHYMKRLQQINQPWDSDDDDSVHEVPGSTGGNWRLALKPLRTKDHLVDGIIRQQRRFHETLTRPHVRFHIRVFAHTPPVARVLASVVAESAFEDGSYQLVDSADSDPLFQEAYRRKGDLRVVPTGVLKRMLGERRIGLYDGFSDLANLAPADELFGVFRMPVAPCDSPRCIRRTTDPPREDPEDLIAIGCDARAGDNGHVTTGSVVRGIRVGNLPKHFLFGGMPGYGKTSTAFSLVLQLAARGIPFIVFEPGKSEYRTLKCLKDHPDSQVHNLAQELQLYTPGSDTSPLRLDPLDVRDGISVNEHIENVSACFKAAMPMSGPLAALLAEALERVYWDHPTTGHRPRMADLHAAMREVLSSKRYSPEVDSDLRAALEVRLGVLTRRDTGRVFQCDRNIPPLDQLMAGHSVIELGSLPQELACLLTVFLLTSIREHVKCTPWAGRGVRLVLIWEEAHNVVGRSGDAAPSEENADPKAYATEFICRMLAELRALGVAIVIIDQFPSALAPEVIRATASKLAFRQVANADREALGGAMLFGSVEMEEVARFRPGEAFFHTEGYFGPQRIRTPNLQKDWDLPTPPLGDAILPYLRDEAWFKQAATERLAAELEQLARALDDYDGRRTEIAKETTTLLACHPTALGEVRGERQLGRLAQLARRAQTLRDRLRSDFRVFHQDVYTPLVGASPPAGIPDEDLRAWHSSCVARFEVAVRPATTACLRALDRLIQRCDAGLPPA